MVIGIRRKLAEKDYTSLLDDHIWQLILEIGIVFLILQMMGYASIFYTLGLVFILIGLLIAFRSFNPLRLMDITAFIGADMSYARLLALALATSAIAMTINLMAKLLLDIKISGINIGLPFAILLLVGGHIFNFAINVFGSFIHSMRLHYLEFYSMFYEGDGRKFIPFNSKRKLTKTDRR